MINISLELFFCCLIDFLLFLPSLNISGAKMCSSLTSEGKMGESSAARSSNCWESPKCSQNQLHPTAPSKPKEPVLGCSDSEMTPHRLPAHPKTGAGSPDSTDSHHSPKTTGQSQSTSKGGWKGTFPSCMERNSSIMQLPLAKLTGLHEN